MQEDRRAGTSRKATAPNTKDASLGAEWVFVSLEQAAKWLAGRRHNRLIRKGDVGFMARQMREGLWKKNPQPLLFDADGRLVDGQHRLSAMVEAQVPMWFCVGTVETDVMLVLDTGRSRNGADTVALLDTSLRGGSYSATAAALKLLLAWEKNRDPFTGQTGGSNRISNLEVGQAEQRFPTLYQNVLRGQHIQKEGIPGGTGSWAALLTKFEMVDADLCEEFFEGMVTGANLPDGSPILAVRNRLRASRSQRYALPRAEFATWVIRGWNAFVKGRPLTIVRGRVRSEAQGRQDYGAGSFPIVEGPSKAA